ncbi:MAG TPA: BamA/TamA family outer membrane protein [Acidocella sp.]|jgi:translocation and assembly module TamA|uniref:autotransporter assembly complex protein TamA n=1 Tax=Acidocella sp. TaxID=50710 RepID=UPI002C64F11E|nr:BamA/TamA family outer membrane protein [Acidocella sp.]HVE21220.1 BamA/TamA family outer membrane protein [Acidocella sp.]
MRRCQKYLIAGLCVILGPAAYAAETVHYTVTFQPSGDAKLDTLLKQTSSLASLQKGVPAAPFALIGRAQADTDQFTVVLHSLGYDAGTVTVTIDGMTLSDPALFDHLQQAPAGESAKILITAHPGAVFRLGRVDVTGLPPGFKPPALVKPGQEALAAPILAVTPALRTALHNEGYAFASVSEPQAVAVPAAHRLDVSYQVTAGPRVKIGPIRFSGLTRTNEAFLRRHIALQEGQTYSDTAITAARDSLLNLGVFSAVTPLPQDELAPDGQVPILFRVTQQKLHAVTFSGSYATDVGMTIGASWENRDLFSHAETLTFTAAANGLGGTGTVAPGYDLKAVFAKPDYYMRGQTLTASLEALDESLNAYDRTAIVAGVQVSRPLTPHITLSTGPRFVTERVVQNSTARSYVLAQLPTILAYNTTDSVLEPTRGVIASLSLTPTEPLAGTASAPFLIAYASASTYLAVEPKGRGIIAVRGQVGTIQGASQFQVPADQRFYAGGSGTVRGYAYQTVGPLFPNDTPEGGLALDAFSLEFRQHIGKSFGIVPFVDAGQVNTGSTPFTGRMFVGAGLGGRYYTSIGPIRVDFAVPMTRVAGDAGFQIYVGLGEAF